MMILDSNSEILMLGFGSLPQSFTNLEVQVVANRFYLN